ncbi:hypothetical protein [Actinoplanes sp. CA-252034]|uniref:hypothetical protein n=1 Tax=Actinoplanes sp. CA-252034 TaxID=3239906 RepID=UPI003D969F0F
MTAEPVPVQPETVQEPEHMAMRPSWDCRVCGAPWPCASAKVALSEEYRSFPSLLTLFLMSTYQEAREHLGYLGQPADLFERIVGWAQGRRR